MNIPLKKGCDSGGLYGHYVCVYSINLNTNTVGICDCNYDSEYGGKYTATVADVVDAMHRSNGANNLIW